jgi:hypothetical protein
MVQRGTAHVWRNNTDDWCRTANVMVGSQPLYHDGEPVAITLD